jgi:hypothetical protein
MLLRFRAVLSKFTVKQNIYGYCRSCLDLYPSKLDFRDSLTAYEKDFCKIVVAAKRMLRQFSVGS